MTPPGSTASGPLDWRVEEGLLPYPQALEAMRGRADAIRAGEAGEQVWLVEHPPLYTAGSGPTTAPASAPRM